jgi:glycosyltransferase AglD
MPSVGKTVLRERKLFLILPVYKSRRYLLRNLPVIHGYLKSLKVPFEIIIAEDGSSDVLNHSVQDFLRRNREVSYIHSDRKLGRGRAIKNAVKKMLGDAMREDIVGYMDIDLATDIRSTREMLAAFDEGDYDVVVGSRYAGGMDGKGRTQKRLAFSLVFNLLVRSLLGSKVLDHQCGFKFFRYDFLRKYADMAQDDLWFWDTEILVLAQRDRKSVLELPVKYNEAKRSTVKLFGDTASMLENIIRLLIRIHRDDRPVHST